MKKVLLVSLIIFTIVACSNNKKEPGEEKSNYIALRTDSVNVIKVTDTLVIYESTCRGCAYEATTSFSVSDTLGLVKLVDVKTNDSNPEDMNGGSIGKTILLLPQKPGNTTFKLYKFWNIHNAEMSAKDSANAISYTVQIQN